jgi:hypothetical protein
LEGNLTAYVDEFYRTPQNLFQYDQRVYFLAEVGTFGAATIMDTEILKIYVHPVNVHCLSALTFIHFVVGC